MDQLAERQTHVTPPTDITLNERDMSDLEMYFLGGFAPLNGYNTLEEFCSIVLEGRLNNDVVWPIPFVLAVDASTVTSNEAALEDSLHWINLRNLLGTILARVKVKDCYKPNIEMLGHHLLGTTDINHPYMEYLKNVHQNTLYVGGEIYPLQKIMHFDFTEFRKTTDEIKDFIKRNHYTHVIGFQTRNPMHRSHFELTCEAVRRIEKEIHLEPLREQYFTQPKILLLITPTCGPTQPGDVDSITRIRCYKKLLPYYHNIYGINASLVILPLAMRMAGPKEAVWHALIRKNFGCTHFIVGRDHAGPSTRKADGSNFYEPYAAHNLLKTLVHQLGITPLFFSNMVYVGPEHGGYVLETMAPPQAEIQQLSGTKFRELLKERKPIPEWYSFPPIIHELQKVYKRRHEQGFCMYFTGLPCSGKSTLASAVAAKLREREFERRQISVLDADIVRLHLSKGLGYSRKDRSINVRRIGYVASVITYHNGIVLVANIAPYEEDRVCNRELIESTGGGYIEVFVSTPLSVCQARDVKQHYKKARLGLLKQFTGVNDPYEIPTSPELTIDSSNDIIRQVDLIMSYLENKKWIQ